MRREDVDKSAQAAMPAGPWRADPISGPAVFFGANYGQREKRTTDARASVVEASSGIQARVLESRAASHKGGR